MGYNLFEKGMPRLNEASCIGCGQCVKICADEVLSLENGKAKPGKGIFMGCIACGHCVAICPTDSIAVAGRGMKEDDHLEFPAAVPPTPDSLERLLVGRRSIRRFKPQEIAPETINRILRMSSTAPMGIPPSDVDILVFQGRKKVQEFAENAIAEFEKMARFFSPFVLALMRPILGREQSLFMREFVKPLLQELVEKRKAGVDYFTYDAPAALLFHYGPMSDGADCHIAATYAMLAAESLGLGSCMLGTTTALSRSKDFKKKYGVPLENKFGLALILGYPAVSFHRGVRRRFNSVVFA